MELLPGESGQTPKRKTVPMKPKRKTDPDGTKLHELRAKAFRRSDKLANTLRKLVAKSDPNDASIKPLLKGLEPAQASKSSENGRRKTSSPETLSTSMA